MHIYIIGSLNATNIVEAKTHTILSSQFSTYNRDKSRGRAASCLSLGIIFTATISDIFGTKHYNRLEIAQINR